MESYSNRVFTADDYWALPDDKRCELIEGELYDLASPGLTHQRLVSRLNQVIGGHIVELKKSCDVLVAPFAVNLFADDTCFVEPDVSVICDAEKLSERGCKGAPDFVIEIVSPSSRVMDYIKKCGLYSRACVKEYWIVDPQRQTTTVYHFDNGPEPSVIPFSDPLQCGLCDLTVRIADLL